MVVSIKSEYDFYKFSEKVCLPIMEVILCSAVSNLALSNKLHNWVSLNTVLLPQFLTKVVILDGQVSATDLLKIFTANILDHWTEALDGASDSGEDNKLEIKYEAMDEKKNPLQAMRGNPLPHTDTTSRRLSRSSWQRLPR